MPHSAGLSPSSSSMLLLSSHFSFRHTINFICMLDIQAWHTYVVYVCVCAGANKWFLAPADKNATDKQDSIHHHPTQNTLHTHDTHNAWTLYGLAICWRVWRIRAEYAKTFCVRGFSVSVYSSSYFVFLLLFTDLPRSQTKRSQTNNNGYITIGVNVRESTGALLANTFLDKTLNMREATICTGTHKRIRWLRKATHFSHMWDCAACDTCAAYGESQRKRRKSEQQQRRRRRQQ